MRPADGGLVRFNRKIAPRPLGESTMRTIGPRIAAMSATMLALFGASVGTAYGDRWIETVYAEPVSYYAPTSYVTTSRVAATSDVYFTPTSYVYAPTSYSYVPTSSTYVLPSSYATTAYSYLPTSYAYTPTYYATTYYRRPGLLRRLAARPVIETTYRYAGDVLPTTTYLPTTISYEPTVVATSFGCNETAVPFNPPAAPAEDPQTTGKTIRSTHKDAGNEPLLDGSATQKLKAEPAKPKATPKLPADEPLDAPAPEKDAAGAGGLSEPSNDPPKGSGDSVERTSFRKTMKDVQPRQGTATGSQAVLRGEIVSGVTREPKANLQVVFSDLRGRFPDRTKTTDAKGAFEIFLPDGGWTYRVVDPAAPAGTKPKEYDGQVIATSGRYLDESDSPLYGLRLNY